MNTVLMVIFFVLSCVICFILGGVLTLVWLAKENYQKIPEDTLVMRKDDYVKLIAQNKNMRKKIREELDEE